MVKRSGGDALSRQLAQAVRSLKELNGELGSVSFDPGDPDSIEAAILSTEAPIDSKLGDHRSSPMLGLLAEQMKELYRSAIIDRASAARLKDTLE